MIPGSANPLLLASAQAATAYNIERSLRFNGSADSAYLSRTPSVAGNRKTWTWAGWAKRGQLGGSQGVFTSGTSNSNLNPIYFGYSSADTVAVLYYNGSFQYLVETASVFRDPSAWYHVIVAYDSTQITPSDRIKIYANGTRQTSFTTASYPAQNLDGWINASDTHAVGAAYATPAVLYSGYLADIHFIDGQALDPTSFGYTDTNGVWQPKAYTGTYGTNGFHLPFSDNSTAAALGTDTSGNSNTWTVNNISIAAGAGNDSLVDTPTSYGTDTGAGGEVRGNYCTLNPLNKDSNTALSNGNLNAVGFNSAVLGTLGLTTGKWYWEVVHTDSYGPGYWGNVGVVIGLNDSVYSSTGFAGVNVTSQSNIGGTWSGGSRITALATWADNDVVGMAFDADAKTLDCYKNGVKIGSTLSVPTGAVFPSSYLNGTSSDTSSAFYNFGQRPFAYPVSGYKALCTTNLPEPQTITTSGSYTGNGVADGPFVYLNGVPTAMTVNGTAVTFGTHADKLSNGFKLRTTSTTYNQNAATYNYSVTSTGPTFKTARAQAN